MKTNVINIILLKVFILLLSACLITACSSNSDEGDDDGNGTENGGNGNQGGDDGNGDGEEEGKDELEGYIPFKWDTFEYVFNSLKDVYILNYRLPFKNVDAKPEDYGWLEKVDSIRYNGVIFAYTEDDKIIPFDTTAYMIIYMVSNQQVFNLTRECFYGNGDNLGGIDSFYDGYKPKGINFLNTREDLWDFNLFSVSAIKYDSGGYHNIDEAMGLGIKHLYRSVSALASTHNTPDGKRRYFLENFSKLKE